MISRTQKIVLGFVALAAVVNLAVNLTAQGPKPSLDYEFFKNRVQPIFLKQRGDHARCFLCHSVPWEGGKAGSAGTNYLMPLSPGATSWTEEQSRRNFQMVSLFVVPGDLKKSKLLNHPLAPEAGGDTPIHGGGRQFESQNDPDWQTLADWVRGKKMGD